jgi:hypothetical protein
MVPDSQGERLRFHQKFHRIQGRGLVVQQHVQRDPTLVVLDEE